MNILKSSENLSFIFEKLKNLKFNGGRRLEPSEKNALELLFLHDLAEVIKSAKQDESFDKIKLQEILEEDYIQKAQSGKSAQYYNFKKALENPEHLEHLKAMLN